MPSSAAKAHIGLFLTGFSYCLLLLLFLYWYFTRTGGPNWVVLAAQGLPLLLLLPGLWLKYHRSFIWLCFLMLLYFIKAVDGAFSPLAHWSDYVFVALTVMTFVSAMLTSRWLQRLHKG